MLGFFGLAGWHRSCYNQRLSDKNWSIKMPETIKKAEKPNTTTSAFVESVSKKGTEANGLRINFHFVRRKRKNTGG